MTGLQRILAITVLLAGALSRTGHSQRLYFHTSCPSRIEDWLSKHPQDSAGSRVYGHEDSVDAPPRQLSGAAPRYPDEARKAGYEAQVVLTGVVERDGTVSHAEVVHIAVSDPPRIWPEPARNDRRGPAQFPLSKGGAILEFRLAALRLLRQSRFEPGTKNGEPVRTLICLPVNYRMRQ
jgi:hypothetical protein